MHLLFPLASSLLYVVAAMFLKQSASLGIDVWRTGVVCNCFTALLFLFLWPLGGTIPEWSLFYQPALVALLFVAGQLLTFLALKKGDVSVATPVMGSKVVMVAVFTIALGADKISLPLWIAAALSCVGIAFLNRTGNDHHHVTRTVILALLAAACYALFDVLVMSWAPLWGTGRFLPIAMLMAGILSLGFIPFFETPKAALTPKARRALYGGALFIGLQAIILVSSLANYGDATAMNVIYCTRGLWSVLVVWWLGHYFANTERNLGPAILRTRLLGAVCLCAAVGLVFV